MKKRLFQIVRNKEELLAVSERVFSKGELVAVSERVCAVKERLFQKVCAIKKSYYVRNEEELLAVSERMCGLKESCWMFQREHMQ